MTLGYLNPAYRTALLTCAPLNLAMLFIEGGVSLQTGSAALLADAADFLEDAAVLGVALVPLNWTARKRAGCRFHAGRGDGLRRACSGWPNHSPPARGRRSVRVFDNRVAILALLVNGYCAYHLVRLRTGDASMRAIWLSARSDALLNLLTVAAAGLIAITRTALS